MCFDKDSGVKAVLVLFLGLNLILECILAEFACNYK